MRKCKRFISALLMAAMLVSLMCVPVMATGDCGYASEDPEDLCTFWTVYDKDYHWFICIEHKDENGDNPILGDKEPHELDVDGRCNGCGYDATPDQGGDDDGNIGAIVGEEVLAVLAELSFVAAEMGLEPLLECVVNGDTAVVRATENASETVEALGMAVEIPEVFYAGFEIAITFPKDADYSYNGSPVEPAVVKNQISGSYLEALYEVCDPEYSNNNAVGTATVSVDIINHSDESVVTITKTFEITEGESGNEGGNEGDVDEDMLLAYLIECSYKAVEGGFEAPLELKSVGESSAVLKATDNAEEIMAEQGYNVTIPEHLYGGFRIGIDIPAGSDLSYNGTPVKPAVIVNETDVTGLAGFVDVGDLTYSNNNGVGTATVSAVIRNRSNNETITLTKSFEIVEGGGSDIVDVAELLVDISLNADEYGVQEPMIIEQTEENAAVVRAHPFAEDILFAATGKEVEVSDLFYDGFIIRIDFAEDADYTYTGEPVEPAVLNSGIKYTCFEALFEVGELEYTNNIKVGTATVAVDILNKADNSVLTLARQFEIVENGDEPVLPPVEFTDVPEGAYYEGAVAWAVKNGITAGIGNNKFAPNDTCTRSQVVSFIHRGEGEPTAVNNSNPFSDVKSTDWFFDPVLWAVESNITAGMSATSFGPNVTCTRGQVVTFLWRAAGEPTVDGGNSFVDVPSGAYYEEAVNWAVEKGITAGISATNFAPDATCTRGQVVCFMQRYYEP